METLACKMCGKLFNYAKGLKVCPACEKKMEDKFAEVKDYIYDNHHVSIQEVAQEFDIPPQQIKYWVREERLAFAEDSPVSLTCEACGSKILTGRYCETCKKRLQDNLENMYQKPKPTPQKKKKDPGKDKMRFLNN